MSGIGFQRDLDAKAAEQPRDRWKRPLIVPPGGGEPVPYTRVSTLAKELDKQDGLMAWKQRKTAEGLTRRPDLLTRIAGELANGDPDKDWPTKKALNAICREATEAAGASSGASSGTGLHALTQALDAGREPLLVPEDDKPRLADYIAATARYETLDIETFVVNDELGAAGTFDRLYRCPDGAVRVADLKTGKGEADFPLATAMQIAIYANSVRYDHLRQPQRTPLHKDLDATRGLLVHLPATGGCRVIELNLTLGYAAAITAYRVRDIRAWRAADISREASV